jgi:itaconate CoA-transferase
MGLHRELEGITVVSVEQAVAAPYCGLLLADAGARVIKVERQEGDLARGYDKGADGQSTFFAWLNRGKESICVDLKNAEDQALLKEMLNAADVFLSNLSPGAIERAGFDGEALRASNPGLITCQINGYGKEGSGAQKKAYDFLIQAESGVVSTTGTGAELARVGVSLVDISSGLTAFSAILRALIQRGRTGKGVDLSISMFDVMGDWMNMPLMGHRYMGGAPKPIGLTHSLIAPYGAYTAGDGYQVLIAIQSNREWENFCNHVLEHPAMATDPRFSDNTVRTANRVEMDDAINRVFSQHTRLELVEILGKNRIACAQLNSVADLSSHPLLNNLDVTFDGAIVSVADLPIPTDGKRQTIVPTLDQHGAVLRQEFAKDVN